MGKHGPNGLFWLSVRFDQDELVLVGHGQGGARASTLAATAAAIPASLRQVMSASSVWGMVREATLFLGVVCLRFLPTE